MRVYIYPENARSWEEEVSSLYVLFHTQRLTLSLRKSAMNSEHRASLPETQPTDALDSGDNNLLNDDGALETEVVNGIPEDRRSLEARLRQLYPVFLHPENDTQSLQELKRTGQEDQKSPEGFAPLASRDMIRYALENTYNEISGLCPIFDLPTLQRLNTEQQAASSANPAGNPARWAILSTWIALGMRLRTAPGSEAGFSPVVQSYYRNAVLVLPDLILQPANTETIQALLLMAVFADGGEDHRSFVMLVTNAARQIELLALQLTGVSDRGERDAMRRLLAFARLLEGKVAERCGLKMILDSVVV